jgi:hypothetical protein
MKDAAVDQKDQLARGKWVRRPWRFNTGAMLNSSWRDFRWACRQIRQWPGLALLIALTLAIGIGPKFWMSLTAMPTVILHEKTWIHFA